MSDQHAADDEGQEIPFHGFNYFLGGGDGAANFVKIVFIQPPLQIERDDVRGVGGQDEILGRLGRGGGERLQIGALAIHGRRGVERRQSGW